MDIKVVNNVQDRTDLFQLLDLQTRWKRLFQLLGFADVLKINKIRMCLQKKESWLPKIALFFSNIN